MGILDKIKGEFIDIIEWLDASKDTIVYRYPRYDNEIKYGAKLVVRESQCAVFINEGQIADVFQPGTFTLITQNLPILGKLKGWKYGFESPFKAEVYFLNTRIFTDLKWGTKQPIMMRDPEFGPVRLRAFGTYTIRVKDAIVFIREIVGTDGNFTTDGITEQIRNILVARFADMLGENKIPILDLAANYNEMGDFITGKLKPELEDYGLEIAKVLIESISLPQAVEEALDKRSSMGIIGNMQQYTQFQAANAIEEAAKNQGAGGMAAGGMGVGLGFAMANQMGQTMGQQQQAQPQQASAPPPLPGQQQIAFFAAINGQQAGPFDLPALNQMIGQGKITRETLVWKQGMANWTPAAQVNEIQQFFSQVPPPLPPQ